MDCTQRNRRNAGIQRSAGTAPVVIFDCLNNETVQAVSDTEKTQIVLTGPDFAEVGPALDDLIAHVECTNFGTNIKYDVVLQKRYKDGPSIDAGSPLLNGIAPSTDPSYQISTPFADRQQFGMQIRLVLRVYYTASGSVGERADFSVAVAARFYN
jgi:hypothetical protein